jgi:hypothetical protein
MTKPISIRVDPKTQPNLRKLARALIALARQRLDEGSPPEHSSQEHEAGP